MKKLGLVFAALFALGLTACGDDDDDVVVDSGTVTADSSTTVDGGATVDAATATCSATVTPSTAAVFCAQYMTTCGFGASMRFASMSDCTTMYGAFASARQQCATYHLCNAGGAGQMTLHCPHATGLSVCTP